MSPEAQALLTALNNAPLAAPDFRDGQREPLLELYRAGLVDLFEPPPYEWRLTWSGRVKAERNEH